MPSVISSSDKKGWFSAALFQKNLSRFWPLWVLYGLAWFFALPMNILLLDASGRAYLGVNITGMVNGCITATPFVGAVYGILLAMALFSHLMNNRATGMIHALPLRREGIFLTAYASAAVTIGSPTLLVALITLAAEGSKGVLMAGDVFKWFGCNLMLTLFFFAFGVFCAMFTGHILALPVFYGIMNFLVIGVCFLLDMASSVLLTGFDGWNLTGSNLARWCTPAYQLYNLIRAGRVYPDDIVAPYYTQTVLAPVCYSLVLFCVFTVLALAVYRNRQLERAGDVVSVGVMRPVFQYGVGVCVGLALGGFLYMVFFRPYGPWAYVCAVAVSAFIGAFAARMLLKKSVHVFKDWKGPVACALAMLLLLSGIKMDVFGFQRRVPDINKVESVVLSGVYTVPDDRGHFVNVAWTTQEDPERVQEVLDFHRALVAGLGRLAEAEAENRGYYDSYAWDDQGYQIEGTVPVTLTYAMKDGTIIRRSYTSVPITANELATEGTYANRLQALLNHTDTVKRLYLRDISEEGSKVTVTGATLYAYAWRDNGEVGEMSVEEYDRYMSNGTIELSYEDANLLWTAFQEDLEAGRVRRYLLDDKERMENCYYYNNLSFETAVRASEYVPNSAGIITVVVTPEKSMTSLMAALEQLGLTGFLQQRDR